MALALFYPHNLLIHSEEFEKSWIYSGTVIVSENVSIAPNGNQIADSVNFVTVSSSISQNSNLLLSISSISLFTFSVYVKSVTGSKLILSISTNQSNSVSQTIDTTSKWTRFSVSVSASIGTSSVLCTIQHSISGSGTTFDLWGAQLNSGEIQPYYKTTTAVYKGETIDGIFVPSPGDLKINSSHKTIVEWDDGTSTKSPVRTEFATTTKISTTRFGTVLLDGIDLHTRINNISQTSGIGSSNITNASIVSNSIHLDKFDTMSVLKGGTESTQFGKGEVLYSGSGKIISSPNLKIDSSGLNVSSNFGVDFVSGSDVFTLKSGSQGLILATNKQGVPDINLTNNMGSSPTITSMVLSGTNLTYTVNDKDGDLRSIHIIWSSSQAKPVISTPSQILQYTLNSAYIPLIQRTEIDLVRFPTTGRSSVTDTFVFPSGGPIWAYVVVEDGPGNFSTIKEFP
jgi:hypothetical protein